MGRRRAESSHRAPPDWIRKANSRHRWSAASRSSAICRRWAVSCGQPQISASARYNETLRCTGNWGAASKQVVITMTMGLSTGCLLEFRPNPFGLGTVSRPAGRGVDRADRVAPRDREAAQGRSTFHEPGPDAAVFGCLHLWGGAKTCEVSTSGCVWVNRKLRMETDFSRRLRTRRIRIGWDQVKLAEAAGVSVSSVSAWERGVNMPTGQSLEALAAALGVHAAWLVGGAQPSADPADDRERLRLAVRRIAISVQDLAEQVRDLATKLDAPPLGQPDIRVAEREEPRPEREDLESTILKGGLVALKALNLPPPPLKPIAASPTGSSGGPSAAAPGPTGGRPSSPGLAPSAPGSEPESGPSRRRPPRQSAA